MGEARIEILYALYLEDELSTRELGEWVDREDNGLNYHLRRLRSAGLINQKRFKPEGGDYSFYELSGVGRLVVSAFLNTVEQANDVPREPSLD